MFKKMLFLFVFIKFAMKKQYLLVFLFVLFANLFVNCSKDDSYVPVDVLPIATDDTVSSTLTAPLEIHVLDNDTTGDIIVPTSVSISNGQDTDANGTLDRKIVPNEGTWSVNATTGVITFTPLPTFVGNSNNLYRKRR